ncbi:Suppressor of the cold-sensitive snRNP biogenesis mutant brr1-1 [Ascosphaera pollenicola]|nr:Suppressor of the cold-sensitive snRNP biogenesis mutant brr1-1 [Ascosphaera pollenicola]
MGASASKPLRNAASASGRRQYPTKPSALTRERKKPAPAPAPGPNAQEQEPWATKSQAIEQDARDPHLAAFLRTIGPVAPTPTLSNSSTAGQSPHDQTEVTNPTSLAMRSRARLAEAADQELLRVGMRGHLREFVDVQTLKRALTLRERHEMSNEAIEDHLGLKSGVMRQLGQRGLVENVQA